MTRILQSVVAFASVLICSGCETGSNDSTDSGPVANYGGAYNNGGAPLASRQSGTKITSMTVVQEGDKLLATDNLGINFRGSIGATSVDGLSPFDIKGTTSGGTAVSIIGAFSRDGSRARMDGNWIEPTVQSTFLAFSGDPPPATAAPTGTPAPAASESGTAPAPAPTAERSSADYINAPASFSVGSCEFKDDGDVGGWPITTILRSVSVSGGQITMVYDDVSWPKSGDVNGNCWLVIDRGGWEASTFDYLKPNQETKSVGEAASKRGIHSGEKVGVFVSTLARDDRRNGDQRSNIFWITWP